MQFGPWIAIDEASQTARHARSSAAVKPLLNTTAERTPAASSSARAAATPAAGMATTAVSTPRGRAAMPLATGRSLMVSAVA